MQENNALKKAVDILKSMDELKDYSFEINRNFELKSNNNDNVYLIITKENTKLKTAIAFPKDFYGLSSQELVDYIIDSLEDYLEVSEDEDFSDSFAEDYFEELKSWDYLKDNIICELVNTENKKFFINMDKKLHIDILDMSVLFKVVKGFDSVTRNIVFDTYLTENLYEVIKQKEGCEVPLDVIFEWAKENVLNILGIEMDTIASYSKNLFNKTLDSLDNIGITKEDLIKELKEDCFDNMNDIDLTEEDIEELINMLCREEEQEDTQEYVITCGEGNENLGSCSGLALNQRLLDMFSGIFEEDFVIVFMTKKSFIVTPVSKLQNKKFMTEDLFSNFEDDDSNISETFVKYNIKTKEFEKFLGTNVTQMR